ncbi:valine--tRNA ligase [Alkalilacustris brevis]|uniref:valine--tRNA ligase n=1 Tax=Alkalilacustris brevis TaxID=2026338 RepID=UPI000E0CDC22|nr:valine--tRNA ligase [Alkalilacustris brevis]
MAMEKTFDAKEAEARIAARWEKENAFAAGANASRDESFCIMIPPPNVTGSLHMGHAFNNTLQDILVRWHRMRGFDTLWQPGQDHAGIATQMVVERELAREGKQRTDFTRDAFLAKVWEWKQHSGGTIINQLKRLGASCDWSRNAFTMSGAPNCPEGEEGNFHDAVIKVFVDMYNKDLIYRGKRLVNWDPHFETAISDLEVEQIEVDGHMWRLRYKLADGETYEHPTEWDEDGNVTATETRDYLVVATTRPETMLGDTGIAVHPDDARYKHLIGKDAILPLVGRRLRIVADDYADPEKGTGAVKMTPAHDFNDWAVGQRQGLLAINVMNTRAGMWLKDNPDFAEGCEAEGVARLIEALDGADRYEARDWIVQTATEEGWLDGIDPDRHMVPHGDRSKVAIEPYLTDQWFVDAEKVVGPALDAVRSGRVKIMPESGEKTYYHWLENIEPWCISRQLWWGHQIPVWYGPKIDKNGRYVERESEKFCAPTFEAARAQALEHYRSLRPNLKDVQELEADAAPILSYEDRKSLAELLGKPEISVPDWKPVKVAWKLNSGTLFLGRESDVLDTWFSSGLWPIGTLGWPEDTEELRKYFPTSVLVTGQDILFFWVARMMMMQLAVVNDIPFREVYLHGLVRDAKGKKMSKSLGNVIDPLEIIDEYGADALRFANAAMASLGGVLKLDTSRIAGYRNFGTKLWNATRFAEMNGVWEGHATRAAPPAAQATVNRWIIAETARVREKVDAALDAYRFNDAASALYAFVWGKVCDWYVEFAKPLFDGDQAAETRETMAWVLDQCMILLHPIMPFVTEELWGLTGRRDKLLVHADWPGYAAADLADAEAMREMRWVIALIEGVRSARAQMGVPVGLRLEMLQVDLDEAGQGAWARNAALIKRLARIESLSEAPEVPRGAVTIPVEGGTFALPLAGVIDVAAESARLEKALGKLDKELGGLRGRLSNAKFIESAPEDVVEETREAARVKEDEAAKLRAALDRLAALG